MSVRCTACGYVGQQNSAYCVACGTRSTQPSKVCLAENPAESIYCGTCGALLPDHPRGRYHARPRPYFAQQKCPRCEQPNEPGSMFCYDCGLPLDALSRLDNEAIQRGGTLAGFWIRWVAMVADILILTIGLAPLAFVISNSAAGWVAVLAANVYFTATTGLWGGTPGKRLLGLKVVRPDGSRIGLGRSLVRTLAYVTSYPLFLGFLIILIRRKKTGFHDRIADTRVIEKFD